MKLDVTWTRVFAATRITPGGPSDKIYVVNVPRKKERIFTSSIRFNVVVVISVGNG